MKVLKIMAGVVAAVLVLFLGAVLMQPATSHIERTKVMAASPADVYSHVSDLQAFQKWNPWADMDPGQKVTVSDPPTGKGAWYTWEGETVGKGKMTITDVVENQKVVESLQFIAPFESTAVVTFTLKPEGESTKVVWGYDAQNGFMNKAAGMFMDMDTMLGGDFDKGLNKLAPLAKATADARIAAEAAKAAEAAAAAALATDAALPGDGGSAPPTP